MSPSAPRARPESRRARTTAVVVTLSAALLGTSACSSDLRLKGPSQTSTVTAPASVTIKGKNLRCTSVAQGGATIEVGGAVRTLRTGDTFSVDDIRFSVDHVDDATHAVTLTGQVVLTWP